MKIKYLLPGLVLSASLLVSCGEEKTETKETEAKEETVKEEVEEVDEISEIEEIEGDAYSEESVQSQWDDIVAQVKSGEKVGLNMYLDGTSDSFSQEEWDYLDLTQPEYAATFDSYATFNDIPAADNMPEGTKVVQVYFETESDGQVFESAAMIYLIVEDGLIWINGCELVG